jgi:formylglycine-generating enzyme required for sulfatase activity
MLEKNLSKTIKKVTIMRNLSVKSHWQALKTILCGLTLLASVSVYASPSSKGMAAITNGWFLRGDANDANANGDAPTNQVFVSAFQMDTNLVSVALWQQVYNYAMNTNQNYGFTANAGVGTAANHPVHTVSWYDAVKWCNARSEMEGLQPCYYTDANRTSVYRSGVVVLATNFVNWTATGYRLPTEAEWERAARGGINGTRFPRGSNTISQADACYTTQIAKQTYDLGPVKTQTGTVPVGSFPPNGYGLYDMAGNIREWCWDWYAKTYYTTSSTNNPQGPASGGSSRVIRGGDWAVNAAPLRCAARDEYVPSVTNAYIGFRCVRVDNTQTPLVATAVVANNSITYGESLDQIGLSGTFTNAAGAAVGGSLAFELPGLVPNAVGSTNVVVIFTPDDTANYSTVAITVSVIVNKATPTITTAPTATAITYGQTLASSTLSGGVASVAGSFAFTAPATVPAVGTAAQSVTFTPTDSARYTSVTTTVSVIVNKATPTITTAPTATAIANGQTLASSTLSGGVASVAGSFAFTAPATVPAVGTAAQSVTFTPTDTAHYSNVVTAVSVTVNSKATPTITTAPTATAITYGQTLASSTLSGGAASVAGTFAFTTPSILPGAGVTAQSVTFTPTDTANYTNVTTAASVTVNRAVLTVKAADASRSYGTTNPTFTVIYAGFVNGETNTVLGGSLTVWSPATPNYLPAIYTNLIIPNLSGLTNNNYSVSNRYGTLTITNSAGITGITNADGSVNLAVLTNFLGNAVVNPADLNVILAYYTNWPAAPGFITNVPPYITVSSGQPTFGFTISNFNYTAQYSTDLSHWTNLPDQAKISFVDTNAANQPQRFYRLISTP